MAKPGELAELIARMFRLEEATVRQQARELRDHGLMSKERAGRGVGTMTAKDAAHLLTAAAITTSVKKSVECVHMYQACRASDWRGSSKAWALAFLPSAELSGLTEEHSFIDAIEAALIAFSVGDWAGKQNAFENSMPESGKLIMNFSLSGPVISASSTIMRVADMNEVRTRDKRPDGETHRYGDPNEKRIDYSYHAGFSHLTLIEIANLLRT